MKRRCPVIDMKGTGQNIKCLMEKNGLTVKYIQEYLALGTPQSIYHWFDGRNLPTVDNLYALSELFHTSVDELIRGNRYCGSHAAREAMSRRLLAYYERLKQHFL